MFRSLRSTHLFTAVVLLAIVLAGCQAAAPTAAPVSAPTTAPAAAPTAAPAAANKLKIGFVHLGAINDQGWDTSFHVAQLAIEAAFPGQIEASYVDNVPYGDDITRVLEQMVADGTKFIVITSGSGDYMPEVAKRHPDVRFVEVSTMCKSANCTSFYVKHWDPSYLIGMVAGQLTKTNKLGFIGSFPTKDNYASVNAFHLGARAVNPDVTTSSILINSWFDPQAEKQAAEALFDSGADVLFNIMNDPTILQVAQERKLYAGMWNSDMRAFGPDAYISSVMLDWNAYLIGEAKIMLDGADASYGYTEQLLPMGAGTDRDKWGQNVPAEMAAKADAVREKMLSGETVFKGPIKDAKGVVRIKEGEELSDKFLWEEWTWAVEGVTGMPEEASW